MSWPPSAVFWAPSMSPDSESTKERERNLIKDDESSSSDSDEAPTSGPLLDGHRCQISEHYATLVKSLEDKEKTLKKWKEKHREMEEEVTRLGMQLLRLHNPFYVSESWISSELESAHELLSDSVMFLPKCNDFPNKWKLVNKLLRKSGCPHDNCGLQTDDLMNAEVELLTFAMSSIVWKTLCTPYFIGITPELREVFKDLEKNVNSLEPGILTGRIEDWRSDTLRGLALSTSHAKQVKIECKRAKDLVAESLKILDYDENIHKRFIRELDRNFVQAMANIATQIKLAPCEYTWDWLCPRPVLQKRHLDRVEVLDVATHFTILRPQVAYSHFSENDAIGDCIIPMFPVLFRHGGKDKENVPVSKGYVAVKLHDRNPDYRHKPAVEPDNYPFRVTSSSGSGHIREESKQTRPDESVISSSKIPRIPEYAPKDEWDLPSKDSSSRAASGPEYGRKHADKSYPTWDYSGWVSNTSSTLEHGRKRAETPHNQWHSSPNPPDLWGFPISVNSHSSRRKESEGSTVASEVADRFRRESRTFWS